MKKRLLAVLLVLTLLVAVCASCKPKSKAEVTLVYWTMWSENEPQAQVIKEAAKAFEEETGVAIEITYCGRATIRSALEPALAGGDAIDLFDEDVDRVIGEWKRFLLPLDSYVSKVYDDTNGQPYRDLVNSTLINLVEELGNGSIYQIPYQPFIFTTMYNKDLFAQAGITSTPETWEQFLDACAKLKAIGITPITCDDAYLSALFGYTLVRIVGAEKIATMVADLDFTDPGVLKACEIWENMVKKGYISTRAASNVYPVGQMEEFGQGTVAMYLNGTWLPNELKEVADFNWGSFAWPEIDAAGDGPAYNNYGAQSFGINKNTEHPDEAFAFVRWMTLGTYDQKLADESLGVPMANDATWPAPLADAKAVFSQTTNRFPWAAGVETADISPVIVEGFSKLILGQIDAKGFADMLAAL